MEGGKADVMCKPRGVAYGDGLVTCCRFGTGSSVLGESGALRLLAFAFASSGSGSGFPDCHTISS